MLKIVRSDSSREITASDWLFKHVFRMASGDAAVAAQTLWAMRTDKVYMAFEVNYIWYSFSLVDQSESFIFQVEDAENVEVMFEEQRIIFTCSQVKLINNKKSNEMKKYRNEIDLFGKVKPAVSSIS